MSCITFKKKSLDRPVNICNYCQILFQFLLQNFVTLKFHFRAKTRHDTVVSQLLLENRHKFASSFEHCSKSFHGLASSYTKIATHLTVISQAQVEHDNIPTKIVIKSASVSRP